VLEIEVSQQGYDSLVAELQELRTIKRPQAREQIKKAREYGDLSENSEYHIAKDDQGRVEGRIQELETILAHARVVDMPQNVSAVALHTRVLYKNLATGTENDYAIVAATEANVDEGKISINAPVPQALLGHKKGDEVTVVLKRGPVSYRILDILPLEM
jgi:transcription elongation factor GreA